MSVYSFDTKIAELVGVNAATIYHNLEFWINKNQANNQNFKDGNTWVYNSVNAWLRLFPFMTTRSIRTALEKLVSAGLVETGQYNDKGYDKTTWYAICQKRQVHLSELTTPFVTNDKPIPVSKPVSKPVKDNDRSNDQSSVVESAFEWFWTNCWKPTKKSIGKVDTSPKSFNLEKRWKPLFNKKYFMTHTPERFKAEVNAMATFCKEAHNADRGRFENMQLARFLSEKQWRDA
jgi:hypothetical protein